MRRSRLWSLLFPYSLPFLKALENPLRVRPAGIHEDIPAGDNGSFALVIKLHDTELKLPPNKILGIAERLYISEIIRKECVNAVKISNEAAILPAHDDA